MFFVYLRVFRAVAFATSKVGRWSVGIIGALLQWCADLLVNGTPADRVFAVLMLAAAPIGYWGVRQGPWVDRPQAVRAAPAHVGSPKPVVASRAVEAPVSPLEWSVESGTRSARLRQQASAEGCRLSCAVGGTEAWREVGPCQGTASDRHFVADDCGRSVVFYAQPPRDGARTFIAVYRQTRLEWEVKDRGLTRDPNALAQAHLIRGLGGNGGAPPTYALDGSGIEFTLTDGTSQRVPLVRAPEPEASSVARSGIAKDPRRKR